METEGYTIALAELAELVKQYFGCEPIVGFVDRENPEFEIRF